MRRTSLLGFCTMVLASCGDDTRTLPAEPPNEPLPEETCAGYPDQTLSPYVLPWEAGQSHVVLRGNCGAHPTHRGLARYAYDFAMPIRTYVHAARSGVVIGIEERYTDGNGTPTKDNRVYVLHSDGTVGRYYHLTRWGAPVKLGQAVTQGDIIGLSGNTGSSLAPSLHFDVVRQSCGDTLLGPTCETRPVTFRNTRPHPDGLVEGEVYRAESF